MLHTRMEDFLQGACEFQQSSRLLTGSELHAVTVALAKTRDQLDTSKPSILDLERTFIQSYTE